MSRELPTARTTPGDLARWAFWVPLRDLLSPSQPWTVDAVCRTWPLHWMAAGKRRALMADEYRRCFGTDYTDAGYTSLVRDAYRAAWEVHVEELLLGKLTADTIDEWMRFDGIAHLHTAIAEGRGVVWLYPHAGPIMLMLAGLALGGFEYTQFAARGLAPEAVARDHPALLASNRLRQAVRDTREANEDRIPARYITLSTPVRELHRRLRAGQIVGLAFDGRIGKGWWPTEYLGRTALLSPGPYKLAVSTDAMVIPAFCRITSDGRSVCEVGAPLEAGDDWRALAKRVLRIESAWIRRWPEQYGTWLLHARMRNAIDDHPLFIDHATDERWRRWMPEVHTPPNKG